MTESDYDQFSSVLTQANSTLHPAEAQGALCGLLCLSSQPNIGLWYSFILDQSKDQSTPFPASQLEADLQELREQTEADFSPTSGGITLLLPADNTDLPGRLTALSEWCEGFMYGLGAGGLLDEKKLPETAREFITDVREISRLDPESDDEQAEHYYMELVEYLRVGVLLFREEMLASATMTASAYSETRH